MCTAGGTSHQLEDKSEAQTIKTVDFISYRNKLLSLSLKRLNCYHWSLKGVKEHTPGVNGLKKISKSMLTCRHGNVSLSAFVCSDLITWEGCSAAPQASLWKWERVESDIITPKVFCWLCCRERMKMRLTFVKVGGSVSSRMATDDTESSSCKNGSKDSAVRLVKDATCLFD